MRPTFCAIFEITTKMRCPQNLLGRLKARLSVSLNSARALNPDATIGILDVIAVIGVLSNTAHVQSVSMRIAAPDAMPLLRQMAGAARFVFVHKSFSAAAAEP